MVCYLVHWLDSPPHSFGHPFRAHSISESVSPIPEATAHDSYEDC